MPKRPDITGFAQRILGSGHEDDHPVDSFTADADAGKIINVPVDAIDGWLDQL